MSASRAFIKTVSSVSLVFGMDWFAILGGAVSREVRRIARQNKATHAVHVMDDAASVGVTALQTEKRGVVLYSAAQIVAQRFRTGAIAMVLQLDDTQWWLVAVHEGAVIARTDYVYTTEAEVEALIGQLRQAYPTLTVLDDQASLSLSGLIENRSADAELRHVAHRNSILSRPFLTMLLAALLILVVYKALSAADVFHRRQNPTAGEIVPEVAWDAAVRNVINARWVHGAAGTHDVLSSLYAQPVKLAGWRLLHIECVARVAQWRCHADFVRHDTDASNKRFLAAAPPEWEVSFTPLDQVRVRWNLAPKGLRLGQAAVRMGYENERDLFSKLQSIRPALALVNIDAPEPLPVPAPHDERGQAIPKPEGLPQFRTRTVRIQAPLRSLALLLPYCEAMGWHRLVISMSPHIQPDLTHSRLNVSLQGVLYEKD